MREEKGKWASSRGTRAEAGERDEPGYRRVESVIWAVGCLQRVVRGESCIFNLHCAPFDTSSDLVGVPWACGEGILHWDSL